MLAMMLSTKTFGANSFTDSCVARFNYVSQNNGVVTFKDSSFNRGIIAYHLWYFGDGSYSYVFNPTHTYSSTITNASVTLIVAETSGLTCSITRNIVVSVPIDSCRANFKFQIDSSGNGSLVKFTDLSTSVNAIASRSWTLPDGTHSDEPFPSFQCTFDSALTNVLVCLNIRTSLGCQSSICKPILLRDTNLITCKADFTYAYQSDSMNSGEKFGFVNLSSSNASTWVWIFGDGTYSTAKNPIHIFTLPAGTQVDVWLAVQTSSGCSDTVHQIITLPASNKLCNASFDYNAISPFNYRFTDTSTGKGTVISRQWCLSDSAKYNDSICFVHNFASTLTTAMACLTIKTNTGCQSSACRTIILNSTGSVTCRAGFSYTYQQDSLNADTKIAFRDSCAIHKKSARL
jgi:PKD repeat protein